VEALQGGRLRKYYKLTEAGRKELETERSQWMNVHNALARLWELLPVRD
jgi:DNA-binding PadR family transcriptional regulator